MSEAPGWLTLPTMVHREDLDKAAAAVKALRAELAAAKQYGIDCLSAACVTHQTELAAAHQKSETETEEFWKCLHERDEKINRLVKELAAVREAAQPFYRMWTEADGDGYFTRSIPAASFRALHIVLQSHRRAEETT